MDKESVPHKMVSDPEGYSDLLDFEDRRICETGLSVIPSHSQPEDKNLARLREAPRPLKIVEAFIKRGW
jgi:hypothetical protein